MYASVPEFMWNGIFKLLTTLVSGIIIAAFTTYYPNFPGNYNHE
jgi:hypothetical protein